MNVSLFDALEIDNTERRVASRRALALAHNRVEQNLGRFLRAAQSEEEFVERLALIQDDFAGYVATASREVGHEHPEHIAAALRDHYRIAATHVDFEKTPEEEVEEEEGKKEEGKESRRIWASPYVPPAWEEGRTSCPECGSEITEHGDCPTCGWAQGTEGAGAEGAPNRPWVDNPRIQLHQEYPRGYIVASEDEQSRPLAKQAAPGPLERYQGPGGVTDADPHSPNAYWEDEDNRAEEDRAWEQQQLGEIAAENAWRNQGFHGADEVPPGHPDQLDYMGYDPEGGQPCPHGPHWRHCPTCNPGHQARKQAAGSVWDDPHGSYSFGEAAHKHQQDFGPDSLADDPSATECLNCHQYYRPEEWDYACPSCGQDVAEQHDFGSREFGDHGWSGYTPDDHGPPDSDPYDDERNFPRQGADNGSDKVTCPECGGDGKTEGDTECPKCHGSGKVNNFGPSVLDKLEGRVKSGATLDSLKQEYEDLMRQGRREEAQRVLAERDRLLQPQPSAENYADVPGHMGGRVTADGNTDLDGPEPKMDKGKWTPSNPGEPKIKDDDEHKTVRKDPVDVIGPMRNDHWPLKEIGDIEKKDLPSSTDAFADNNMDQGPHTKTFGDGDQVDPVTHETLSAYAWPSDFAVEKALSE